jgi:hypothetical protein
MKKLITTCIILCCLLTPLKGYGGLSVGEYTIVGGVATMITASISKDYQITKLGFFGIITGIIIYGISSWLGNCHSAFIKAQEAETGWAEKALDFYCKNDQLSPGQAFVKYKWYLSMLARFLTKNPRHNNFRNDLKSVFEMSQNDSRLTTKEKQEIADKFTGNYKFLLPEKQAI